MSIFSGRIKIVLEELLRTKTAGALVRNLSNRKQNEHPAPVPPEDQYEAGGQQARLDFLEKATKREFPVLAGRQAVTDLSVLQGNIENYIGMTQVPTGLIGPLTVNGTEAQGSFYIPLATTEGALVASYNRGAKVSRLCGGIRSVCLIEAVQRSPLFGFANIVEVGKFVYWMTMQLDKFREITSSGSRFARLQDTKTNIEGNQVIVTFEFTTGDAAGQNMVTLAADSICRFILEQSPVKPRYWFLESNYSGDKKATSQAFSYVRGKKVTSELEVSRKVVEEVLKTTPEKIEQYWKSSTIAVVQSGAIGALGHVANGLAAVFLACGQDVACISEASTGITRMEASPEGLYVAVTLPNLIVGTVGGGTGLPTQKECLAIMGCDGAGRSRKFAEICGALALAGELSIAAALSAGHFAAAHKKLGRK